MMQYQKAKRKRRHMPSIVSGLKPSGIAWAKIPNGYSFDTVPKTNRHVSTFEVLAELDRVANGTFKASETFQRKQLW